MTAGKKGSVPRTKTQASFATEQAGLTLLYGLVVFGQIELRGIDGHRALATLFTRQRGEVA